MMGILVLIAITSTGYVFTISLIISTIFYCVIVKFYIRPARDLKKMESISKFSQDLC